MECLGTAIIYKAYVVPNKWFIYLNRKTQTFAFMYNTYVCIYKYIMQVCMYLRNTPTVLRVMRFVRHNIASPLKVVICGFYCMFSYLLVNYWCMVDYWCTYPKLTSLVQRSQKKLVNEYNNFFFISNWN